MPEWSGKPVWVDWLQSIGCEHPFGELNDGSGDRCTVLVRRCSTASGGLFRWGSDAESVNTTRQAADEGGVEVKEMRSDTGASSVRGKRAIISRIKGGNPMAYAAIKSDSFNYGDYCAWPDDERWELIDGVVYNMAPAPSRVHQEVVVELARQIGNFLLEKPCRVYVAPFDVRLPNANQADDQVETVVQPDIAVICDKSKLDEKGCRGAPDWIVEVLSPSTAAKDMIQKRGSYERHGVREYWLVHPLDHLLWIYRLENDTYGKPEILVTEGKTPVSLLDGLEIDWGFQGSF